MRIFGAVAGAMGVLLIAMGHPGARSEDLQRIVSTPSLDPRAPSFEPSSTAPGGGASEVRAVTLSADDASQVIQQTCVLCHNDVARTQDLTLQGFDVSKADGNPVVAEKMIRKLRAGMMPPPQAPYRPSADTIQALAAAIENVLDRAARRDRNPGVRPAPRLNRAEYEAAIKELLALDVSAGSWLPQDEKSANFDNIAEAQIMSPLLVEGYLSAASEISRLAVGDRNAAPVKRTYTNSDYVSQHPWDHVPGAPYGTRGGVVADPVFPADGYYTFQMTFRTDGNTRWEDIDVSIDGERVALVHYDRGILTGGGFNAQDLSGGLSTERVFVRAGQRGVSAAFIRQGEGPYEDLMRPHEWALAGLNNGTGATTQVPHMRDLIIEGPFDVTGVSDTPSRQRVFGCRPTQPGEERPCAQETLSRLARDAYRRPVTGEELGGLMVFFDMGFEREGFEEGVRLALEAILANPSFYFRIEREPEGVRPLRNYRLSDLELASRLSSFLWGTPPDEELFDVASRGRLSNDRELERQVRRMLADPRADALGPRFAAQWLRLQDLYKVRPDPNFFPNYDENLADAMRRETELFFYHLVKEDRPFLEFLTADYTFTNERLARHYGFQNVAGDHFRQVFYEDDTRQGILGHGSVLVLTSISSRTSPVLRGKWVMEVLLGTPPPPPPPNVPRLEETGEANAGRVLTTRQRMEIHRANPTCSSCHRFMDPIGLALDNFDVTGKWRVRENGAPLDTRGELYDGTPVSTPAELQGALLQRPFPLVRTFTENLLTYALGRHLQYYDQPTVREIAREAEADGYRISSFIMGVVKSDAFRMRRAEVDPDDGEDGG
jgi:hypothetical protein